MKLAHSVLALSLSVGSAFGQTTSDPFPTQLRRVEGAIRVNYREFARLPDIDSTAARMMLLATEPGTRNVFVNDMRGPLYRVSSDGRTVTLYLNVDSIVWGYDVQSQGRERGFQSFAFHPQFNQRGTPGFGKFYTWTDVTDTVPPPDFTPPGGQNTHDLVLLEWSARTPAAATYDGDKPRELFRLQHPFNNHNGGLIAFNPLSRPGDADFGLLYVGNADGGSGGDPMNLAQNLGSPFGKILRINPLGRNSTNGKYGIPSDNPFVGRDGALGEIYALGVRNPQRFGWDSSNGRMFVADIGQNTVEELSPVTKGANLGWNVWEGSYRFVNRQGVDTTNARSDSSMTWPIAEFDHSDSLLIGRAAVTGVVVVRSNRIPALANVILFGDMPSGEIFQVNADRPPPNGGHQAIGRVLLNDGGEAKTLLSLIRQKNATQGKQPAARTDLRFGTGPDGQIFVLNKQDGVIRVLVP